MNKKNKLSLLQLDDGKNDEQNLDTSVIDTSFFGSKETTEDIDTKKTLSVMNDTNKQKDFEFNTMSKVNSNNKKKFTLTISNELDKKIFKYQNDIGNRSREDTIRSILEEFLTLKGY